MSCCPVKLVGLLAACLLTLAGCTNSKSTPGSSDADPPGPIATEPDPVAEAESEPIGPFLEYEYDAETLLGSALSAEELEQGWVRLFDEHSLFGWFVYGQANWRAADGAIQVDRGERSYLCTSFQLADYEFRIDFRSDESTNSGIFLRTGPEPGDVAVDCLELNIAPPDNPFPTGSFVQRQKLEPADLGDFDPTQWHTYLVRLVGDRVTVSLDGTQILDLEDVSTSPTGHISLQHNEGRVEFRNVLLRPVQNEELAVGEDWEDHWEARAQDGGDFTAESTSKGLRLKGGLGQVASKKQFGNFLLQAEYTLAQPEVNSGVFFRCVPQSMLDGYECQVNHAIVDNDPLKPGDAGAGAIFRRQPARIVVGDGTEPTHVTLLAIGPQILTWVNGLQTVDFMDTREPDENPRKGLRLEPGPLALQGHDSTTDVTYHKISIAEF